MSHDPSFDDYRNLVSFYQYKDVQFKIILKNDTCYLLWSENLIEKSWESPKSTRLFPELRKMHK